MKTMRADPLGYLAGELDSLREQNLYRPLRLMGAPQSAHTVIDAKPVISLSSNNYLGLATHPRLVEAAIDAVRKYGVGTGAVRTISGDTELIEELERRLADFKHVEAVLTLQSGLTSNSGTIPAITSDEGPDRQRRAQPRFDHRRRPALQGGARGFPAS